MVSFAFLVLFFAFYVLYNTSQKVQIVPRFGFEPNIQRYIKPYKIVGLMLLVVSMIAFSILFGLGSGILFFFIGLMTIASLIVILYPLNLITIKTVSVIFIASLLIEYFIF